MLAREARSDPAKSMSDDLLVVPRVGCLMVTWRTACERLDWSLTSVADVSRLSDAEGDQQASASSDATRTSRAPTTWQWPEPSMRTASSGCCCFSCLSEPTAGACGAADRSPPSSLAPLTIQLASSLARAVVEKVKHGLLVMRGRNLEVGRLDLAVGVAPAEEIMHCERHHARCLDAAGHRVCFAGSRRPICKAAAVPAVQGDRLHDALYRIVVKLGRGCRRAIRIVHLKGGRAAVACRRRASLDWVNHPP